MNALVVPDFSRKSSRCLSNFSSSYSATVKDITSSTCNYSSNRVSLPNIVVKSPNGQVLRSKDSLPYKRSPHRRLKSLKKLESVEINSNLYNKKVKVSIKDYRELTGSTGAFRKLTVHTDSHKCFPKDEPKSAMLSMDISEKSNSPIKRYNSLASIQTFSPLKSPQKLSAKKLRDRLEQAIESEAVSVSHQRANLKNIFLIK